MLAQYGCGVALVRVTIMATSHCNDKTRVLPNFGFIFFLTIVIDSKLLMFIPLTVSVIRTFVIVSASVCRSVKI